MGVITTGQTFSSGDQVTASKLNDIANQAVFSDPVDGSTLIANNSTYGVSGGDGKLKVKDAGITATQLATDSVTTAKIQDSSVTTAKLAAATITDIMPIGAVIPFAGIESTVPSGWLLCDGRTLLKAGTYAPLFAVIGENYGGATTTHFYIPDLRGRVPAGVDGMGIRGDANRLGGAGSTVGRNLGNSGGNQFHQLTVAQMPSHSHTINTAFKNNNTNGLAGLAPSGTNSSSNSTSANTTAIQSNGSGAEHNNCQPTIVLNYIIKF